MIKNKTESIDGSPYYNEEFKLAKISSVEQSVKARYNAYKDEIELDNGKGEYFILPKEEKFKDIKTVNVPEYQYIELKDDDKIENGYAIVLTNVDQVMLLKRERIKYYPAEAASTSYSTAKRARYVTNKPIYYIKKNNEPAVPISKKDNIISLFPDKKDDLNSFFKEQKISFKKEEDLVKLAQFLGTI
ncbi:hypothetical protein GV828_10005 [Flavobacterium sp. NST-5]|uniref:Uncharacterized protein n=1 Tax=Flavobacterium ichthyis TaxID=2698827 RepID=A0ABW9ZFI7_9FLAO|nr:hypothetical protein [Flavobacterium ichthyis]NBL65533.1 hypothetical protein [Flavobacterium ichthyis]